VALALVALFGSKKGLAAIHGANILPASPHCTPGGTRSAHAEGGEGGGAKKHGQMWRLTIINTSDTAASRAFHDSPYHPVRTSYHKDLKYAVPMESSTLHTLCVRRKS
jgi:hypothetical protein